jgi:hypothetical protein
MLSAGVTAAIFFTQESKRAPIHPRHCLWKRTEFLIHSDNVSLHARTESVRDFSFWSFWSHKDYTLGETCFCVRCCLQIRWCSSQGLLLSLMFLDRLTFVITLKDSCSYSCSSYSLYYCLPFILLSLSTSCALIYFTFLNNCCLHLLLRVVKNYINESNWY